MKNNFFHIIIFTVVLFNFTYIVAQESDSLAVINAKYDSLLKSSENEMNVLFYKHKKEMLSRAFPGYVAQLSPEDMASYIYGFSIQEPMVMNGKIISVSNVTP